jgi:hypothetical protein
MGVNELSVEVMVLTVKTEVLAASNGWTLCDPGDSGVILAFEM